MKRYAYPLVLIAFSAVGWGQSQTRTIQVPANQSWTTTGIFVEPGASVLLEARGAIEAVPPSDTRAFFHRVPPEGRPERQSNKPQPLMPALALVARIGNGPVLEVGDRAEFPGGEPYGSGELQLGINDDYVQDNAGSWTVRVTVRGPRSEGLRYREGDTGPRSASGASATSAIEAKARQLGNAFLGPAISETRMSSDGVGRYREYRNATIYWSPNTSAHEVHGAILEKWMSLGAETGDLGYPISDEMPDRDGVSRISRFEHGAIVWNPQRGARAIIGRY